MMLVMMVRGPVNVARPIRDTLSLLNLRKTNTAVVVPENPIYLGMINKARDFITWGEVDEKTLGLLLKKNEIEDPEKVAKDILKEGKSKDIRLIFHLHPPISGWAKKGIRKSFGIGGALGYRGKEINKIASKMLA